jgi:hypothetical protein
MASIENKIREMMNRKAEELAEAFPGMGNNKEAAPMAQGSSEKPEVQVMGVSGAAKTANPVNTLAAGAGAKEDKPMAQGSSEQAAVDSEDDQETQGKTQSAKAKKDTTLSSAHGAGEAPNFKTVADPASVVNQASNTGNVYKEEVEEVEAEEVFISEEEYNALSDEEKAEYEMVEIEEAKKEMEDEEEEEEEEGEEKEENGMKKKKEEMMKKMKEELSKDVENLLSTETELSEEFKTKATSLFEAVVTARVAHEVEIMEDVLAEQAAEIVAEMHSELVNKVDAYLSYVAEQWLEQNAVAVEEGLRTEVTEDFIAGLKVLFKEHYIEVPEEKYNVLGEMQKQIEELTNKVNESVAEAAELHQALTESKRDAVFTKVTSDLAQTESEKLRGLVEEVEFETEELFEQKLTVIKNNYFPKNVVETATITDEQPIVEETSNLVAQYAERIARTKF